MPSRGLEPPRPYGHRPSTCRVCQFRHEGISATIIDSFKTPVKPRYGSYGTTPFSISGPNSSLKIECALLLPTLLYNCSLDMGWFPFASSARKIAAVSGVAGVMYSGRSAQ